MYDGEHQRPVEAFLALIPTFAATRKEHEL